ncbi:MAG: PilZ domain-containing protein [Planctomycetota bacterium]|jgi:c-di-GMP-binding flagellar brake protein YcgR
MGATTKSYDAERREFIRVRAELAVKYKYIGQEPGLTEDRVFEGSTRNISGGGLLLVGPVPNSDWISALLMERIVIGVSISLPEDPEPVNALTRTAWVESLDARTQQCSLGLKFKEITKDHLDRVYKFVIKAQMP